MVQRDLIIKLEGDLKKYLNQKTKYSFKSLKEKLEVETDDDVYFLVCRLLKNRLYEFNFETPVYYNKYLYKCIDYLNDKRYEMSNKNYFIKTLEEIKSIINNNIKHNNSNTRASVASESFLLSLYSGINACICKIQDIEYDEYNEADAYNLMKDLVFKIKNPVYIDEIFDKYEDLSTLKDGQRYLFEDIIDRYLYVLVNSNDRYEILYFDKLVNTFILNTNSEEIKSITMRKTDKLLSNLDEKVLTEERQEMIRFFLKGTTNLYKHVKEDKQTMIENLKIKYDIDRIKSLDKFKLVKPDWKNYKNCNRYIITFDDPAAKIYENAVSLDVNEDGEFLLNYYVSDVNAYLEQDEELREYVRNNSLSFKGNPMLPEELAKRISLIEGKKRKVITFKFKFDSNLDLISFKVDREVIKVKYNLKFSDVKKILEYPVESKLKEKVAYLYAFSKYLPIGYDKEYHEVKKISKKLLYEETYTENNKGSKMINNYQIFLNYFISDYCDKNDLPYLYRNNQFNRSVELISKLKEKYSKKEDIQDMLNLVYAIYEPSYYMTKNKGHLGLNLDAYGEVSKPARSYASVLNQGLITRYFIDNDILTKKEKEELLEQLNEECKYINNKREMHDNYLYELNKVKKKKK